MLIDYLTLMLVNMVAGLVILALYVYRGLDDRDQTRWVPAFGISGLIAVLTGLHMTFTWPLPGAFNIPYGELSVFFGFLLLGAAISIAKGWNLLILGVYGFFAGLAAIIVGLRFMDLGLSKQPTLSGIGLILTGLGGVFAAPTLHMRSRRLFRVIGALVLLAAAIIWAITGYTAYWNHLADFANWVPATLR